MRYGPEIILSALLCVITLLGAGFAVDTVFRQQMWVAFFVIAAFTIGLLRNEDFVSKAPVAPAAYMDGPIRYGVIATVVWGIAGFLVGVVIAAQCIRPLTLL